MSWFSKAFKSVTKEIERTIKKVSREVGRVGAQIGTVVGSLPVPGLSLAGSTIAAFGTVLEGHSGTKAFEAIPKSTLDSLIRGASIAVNPVGALDAMIHSAEVGMEQFGIAKASGMSLMDAINVARQAAGIVKTGQQYVTQAQEVYDELAGRDVVGAAGSIGGSSLQALTGGSLGSLGSYAAFGQQYASGLGLGGLLGGLGGLVSRPSSLAGGNLGGSSPAVQRFVLYNGSLLRR